jgi:hypothetical protein
VAQTERTALTVSYDGFAHFPSRVQYNQPPLGDDATFPMSSMTTSFSATFPHPFPQPWAQTVHHEP